MNTHLRTHLSDGTLIAHLRACVAQDRAITAELLADLAEVDERRLYLPAGYPSMFAYCIEELHFSEDSAYKRIQAARTARRYPVIFSLVAGGRLHLSAICLLAPHLGPENADQLLKEAAHQSKARIEQLLANRFPRPTSRRWCGSYPTDLPQGRFPSPSCRHRGRSNLPRGKFTLLLPDPRSPRSPLGDMRCSSP